MLIEGLLGGVKEQVMLGASAQKLCINWSTRVGNLCTMFRVINRSCQPSALYGVKALFRERARSALTMGAFLSSVGGVTAP